jgi:hypothetical protein
MCPKIFDCSNFSHARLRISKIKKGPVKSPSHFELVIGRDSKTVNPDNCRDVKKIRVESLLIIIEIHQGLRLIILH